MANIKSSKKRIEVAKVRTDKNKIIRTQLKTLIKNANLAIENGENVEVAVKAAVRKIDKASTKGLIHKNKAARIKSNLTKKANAPA